MTSSTKHQQPTGDQRSPYVELPLPPEDDSDFTPELGRKIVRLYQQLYFELFDMRSELLDALKRAEQTMREHNEDRASGSLCDWDFGEGFGGTLDIVRDAIRKAEGK